MSDDDLSTARQFSDASSEPEPTQINCHFTNVLTGEIYFTTPLEVRHDMSIGFIFHTVKTGLGNSVCAFHLQVGKQVWQSVTEDVHERFWESEAVQDALGASDSEECEVIVQVIKLTRQEDLVV